MSDIQVLDLIPMLRRHSEVSEALKALAHDQLTEKLTESRQIFLDNLPAFRQSEAFLRYQTEDRFNKEFVEPGLALFDHWIAQTESAQPQSFVSRGLTVLFAPWVRSFLSVLERCLPALCYRNPVLFKANQLSLQTAELLAQVFANWPNYSVQAFATSDAEVKKFLLTHPAVRVISFVGRHENAIQIKQALGASVTGLSLAWGTKNSAVVLADWEFNHWPELLSSCFSQGGVFGRGVSRIFVSEKLWDRFNDELKTQMQRHFAEPGLSLPERVRNRFCDQMDLAASEGAQVVWGEFPQRSQILLKPLITRNLSNCSVLQQEEISGPFVDLVPVKYPFEAFKWINSSGQHGLTQFWTSQPAKAREFAAKLQVSEVVINRSTAELAHNQAGSHSYGPFGVQDWARVFSFPQVVVAAEEMRSTSEEEV